MEDQDVKRYFIKRGIIVGALALIALAVVFGIRLVNSLLPTKLWYVDVADAPYQNLALLEEEHRVEKVSVAKVVEEAKEEQGVVYFLNQQTGLAENGYTINNLETSWSTFVFKEAYNQYINEYKPTYSVEVSMEQCIVNGSVALIVCGCTDGVNYAYCGAIYYLHDEALQYDFKNYICESEEDYLSGDKAMSVFLDWLDGYIDIVNSHEH